MSEITIGLKTVAAIVSTTAGIVSAYWLARRAAAKDTLVLERQFNKLRTQVVELSANAQDREEVKELVRESLESLSIILTTIKTTADKNSDELKEVLIEQGKLREKVRSLEDHSREPSS